MHTEPRHPDRFAVFFPAGMPPISALGSAIADNPRLEGKPYSLQSGPAWVFSGVDLDPTEQMQAAIALGKTRTARARSLDLDPQPLARAVDAAILATPENHADRLADLLAALDY